MYIECTNNNAVVRTFIALLQESIGHGQTSPASHVDVSEDSDEGILNIQDSGRMNGDYQESGESSKSVYHYCNPLTSATQCFLYTHTHKHVSVCVHLFTPTQLVQTINAHLN